MDFSKVLQGTVDIVYFEQIDEDSQNTLRRFTKVNVNSMGFFNLLWCQFKYCTEYGYV